MPQRPHKTPLDRANSFLHEAERGIKTDPDNGNYWLHKMKEAEEAEFEFEPAYGVKQILCGRCNTETTPP